jgi:serine/threonine protein kinase
MIEFILLVIIIVLVGLNANLSWQLYLIHSGRKGASIASVVPVTADVERQSQYIDAKDLIDPQLNDMTETGKRYVAQYRGMNVSIQEIHHSMTPHDLDELYKAFRSMQHPSLVLRMGLCKVSENMLWVVSEHTMLGPLHKLLANHKVQLKWKQRIEIALGTARAIAFLHGMSHDSMHQNLNSMNIMITENMTPKVERYGMQSPKINRRGGVTVPPYWTAPEVLSDGTYSQKADVYSLGVVLCELMSRATPFAEEKFPNSFKLIQHIVNGGRPYIHPKMPEPMQQLINACLAPNPAMRPSIDNVVATLGDMLTLRFNTNKLVSIHIEENALDKKESMLSSAQQWIIHPSEIQKGELLGMGSFGKVYSGKFRGKQVAIKELHHGTVTGSLREFMNELNINCSLRHPNTVLFIGACIEPNYKCLIIEYCAKGSLAQLMYDKGEQIDYTLSVKLLTEIAQGMNYLHLSRPVILHRDLKPHNILVDDNWTVKISDFGLTQAKGSSADGTTQTMVCGTTFWQAPEALESQQYTEASDVYSFGMIINELFARQRPFAGMNSHQAALAVMTQDTRPRVPDYTPPRVRNLIERCWHRDPAQRPPFHQILQELKVIAEEGLPRLELTLANAHLYRKKHHVYAFPSRDVVTVHKPWGTGRSKPSDWVIVGPGDDVYTCAADIFFKTYEPVPDRKFMYRKTGLILAKQMEKAYLLETLEGTEHGEAGSYIAQNAQDGEQWPIDKETFENMYELAPHAPADHERPSEESQNISIAPVSRTGRLANAVIGTKESEASGGGVSTHPNATTATTETAPLSSIPQDMIKSGFDFDPFNSLHNAIDHIE